MAERSPDRKTIPPAGPAKTAAATAATPTAAAFTLARLLLALTRVERRVLEAFVAAAETADLIAEGGRISTGRIASDGVSIVGEAFTFLSAATPAQRLEIPGVTHQCLASAATCLEIAQTRQRLLDQHRATAKHTRVQSSDAADKQLARGRARREVLFANLRTLAAGDSARLLRLDQAWGVASTHEELATSLDAFVVLGRELVRDATARGVETGLDEAFFADTTALAESVRVAGEASADARGAISQAEVDRWRGVALWFLRRVVDMFDAGHKADPTIPRLRVVSLRSVFRRSARAKKIAPAPQTPPAPQPPPTH